MNPHLNNVFHKNLNLVILLIFVLTTFIVRAQESNTVEERNYCTEIGRFDLLFYKDEVSGSYLLIPKNQLGAIWGKLDGTKVSGRWVDADGEGDIVLIFNSDFSFFRADYRSDEDPDKWYRDSWHGAIRLTDDDQFELNGVTYHCE